MKDHIVLDFFDQNASLAYASRLVPLESVEQSKFLNWLPSRLKGAAEGRKDEYLAGRVCAHHASKKININLIELESAQDRSPIWPKELVGSISHTKGIAIAVVGQSKEFESIGLDVESIILPEKFKLMEKMICTDHDKEVLKNLKINSQESLSKAYTIIFSAKESLFKLIHPLCKTYFDFKEANLINIDFEKGAIVLEIISERPELNPYKQKFFGSFTQQGKFIITGFFLPKNSRL